MQTYTVHEPPDAPANPLERGERLVFVKDGFSWMALLFGPIWMIFHRLWWPLLGYVGAILALGLLDNLITSLGLLSEQAAQRWTGLAGLAVNLLIGFEASTLRRWTLDRGGWRTLGAVSGRSAEECERRFYDLWLPAQAAVAARSGGPLGSDGPRALAPGI
jgi:hypothetical protein